MVGVILAYSHQSFLTGRLAAHFMHTATTTFLLVPAHPGCPGQIPQSRKTVVCVCVCYYYIYLLFSRPPFL